MNPYGMNVFVKYNGSPQKVNEIGHINRVIYFTFRYYPFPYIRHVVTFAQVLESLAPSGIAGYLHLFSVHRISLPRRIGT